MQTSESAVSFNSKKWAFAWYDFANSGFLIIFQAFLFPLFFAGVLDKAGFRGGAWWGWVVALSVLIAVILGPIIGRLVDRKNKSRIFVLLVALTFLFTLASLSTFSNQALWLIVFFVILNTCFELSQTVYDSFLSDIAAGERQKNSISALAYGFGYFGGVMALGLYFILDKFGLDVRQILAISAVLFLIFSVFPMVIFSRIEKNKPVVSFLPKVKTFERLGINLKILAIYWIIADVVTAITFFAALFGERDLHLSKMTIGYLLILMQILAFPLTILGSKIANKFGTVRTIRVSLVFWLVGLVIAFFSREIWHLVISIVIFSFVFGTTQSLLRSNYANRIKSGAGEAFGYFALANKSASVLSPALVGLIIAWTGNVRPAFILLAFLVFVSIYLSKYLGEEKIKSHRSLICHS